MMSLRYYHAAERRWALSFCLLMPEELIFADRRCVVEADGNLFWIS